MYQAKILHQAGYKKGTIAQMLHVSPRTVYNYLENRVYGPDCVRGRPMGGSKLAPYYGLLGLVVALTGVRFGALNSSPIFNLAVAGMALPWPFAGAGLTFLPKPGRWMGRTRTMRYPEVLWTDAGNGPGPVFWISAILLCRAPASFRSEP